MSLRSLSHVIANLLMLRYRTDLQGKTLDILSKAEHRSQLEAERVGRIITTIPSLVIGIETSGVIFTCNPSAEQLLGETAANLIGKTLYSVPLQWDAERLEIAIAECITQNKKVQVDDFQFLRPDGSQRLIGLTLVSLLDAFERPIGALVYGADVTDRRLLEIERHMLADRNRLLLECAGEGIFGVDQHGLCILFNQAAVDMLGYTQEDVMGQHMHDLIHRTREDGSPYPVDECPCFETLQTGLAQRIELDYYWRKDGVKVPVSYTCSPTIDSDRVTGYVVNFTDITERLVTENALQETNQRLQAIISSSPLAIYATDLNNIVQMWNPAAESMFGWTEEEVVGKLIPIVPHDQQKAYDRMLRDLHEGRVLTDLEATPIRKDGGRIDVALSKAAIRDIRGNIEAVITMAADITARKETQITLAKYSKDLADSVFELENKNQELAEARDAALAVAKLKSEFLANMSHEIRTPMNGVLGMLSMLLDTPLSPEQKSYTSTIENCANGLLEIINGILDFSKAEAGKMRLESLPFDLPQVIEESAELLALKVEEKALRLCCDLPSILSHQDSVHVLGDSGRLRQILINLIGNAIKFTPENGHIIVKGEITDDDPEMTYWRISVSDTGIGIPLDRQQMVFDSFTQADGSTTRKYGGTGLGLAICRQLVTLMNGRIGVTGSPGDGSTFWIEVPFKKAPEFEHLDQPPTPLSGRHILLVGEWAQQNKVLTEWFLAWGCANVSVYKGSNDPTVGQDCILVIDVDHPDHDTIVAHYLSSQTDSAAGRIVSLNRVGRHKGEHRRNVFSITEPVKQLQLISALVDEVVSGHQSNTDSRTKAVPSGANFRIDGRILVAEDNPVNQLVTRSMLGRVGIGEDQIEIVGDGAQAVKRWSDGDIALIVMDVQMPEMDGLEATRAIRELEVSQGMGSRTPIIAMTALAMADDRARCIEAGMDDYITKPVRVEEITEVFNRIYQQYNSKLKCVRKDAELPQTDCFPTDLSREQLTASSCDDKDLERRILAEFISSSVNMMARCEMMLEIGDWSSVVHWVHTLKGSCLTIGAKELGNTFQQIESLGRVEDNSVGAILASASVKLSRLRSEITEYLESQKTTLEDDLTQQSELGLAA